MFQQILKLLPVALICYLARKKCQLQPGPGGWRWHQPWRDVLILSQEDYDTFNRKEWLQNLEQKRAHYQDLADQMSAKITEIREAEEEDDDDEEPLSAGDGTDESGPRITDRRAAATLRAAPKPRKRRNAAGSDD